MPHYTFSVTRRHALDTVGDVLDATTESAALAEADARLAAEVARALSAAHARGLVIPFKRWDATHDRRLCARCRALAESTPRPWGVDFPGGAVPGLVHPRCRCVSVTAVMPLAWRAESEEAAQP